MIVNNKTRKETLVSRHDRVTAWNQGQRRLIVRFRNGRKRQAMPSPPGFIAERSGNGAYPTRTV